MKNVLLTNEQKEDVNALKQRWEIDILYLLLRKTFYILGLFQTTLPKLRLKKNIFIDNTLFEGAICKDCRLTLYSVAHKRLRKYGSCLNMSS